MNEETKMYIPYGAAAIGGGLGWWLYGKFPKFGMVGKLIAVGSGVAGGYYISKMILDKYDMKSFSNAVGGSKEKKCLDSEFCIKCANDGGYCRYNSIARECRCVQGGRRAGSIYL